MINLDDYLVRASVRTWYKSKNSAPYDIGLCAHAEMLLLLVEFRNTIGFSDDLMQKLADVRTAKMITYTILDLSGHCRVLTW